MKTTRFSALAAFAASLFALSACDSNAVPSSDQKMNQQQETVAKEGASEVGFPAIVNFTEKREVKQLYELRDSANLRTWSYILDFNGNFHKVCDSVGFGIPYGVQFSNPDTLHGDYDHYVALPQAEPNGLFSPSTDEGTWVMCLDPTSKQVAATYIEPPVTVSQFPLVPEPAAAK
jgi:hypothetical protein